jgi:nucleoside-diphosphate-sugar epimerase
MPVRDEDSSQGTLFLRIKSVHRRRKWACASDVAEARVRAIEAPEGAGEAFNIAREAGTERSFVEALGARRLSVQPRFVAIPRAIHAAGSAISTSGST